MKKALIIGSTVVDVIVNLVDSLPTTGEDVHVRSQHMSLGGCAYNVSDSVRHFQIPYILFSPVGTGVYGYFVREELKKKGISNPIPSPDMDNGCCYCFVEKSGERTFISYHGAEYLFQKDWFNLIDTEEIDSAIQQAINDHLESASHKISLGLDKIPILVRNSLTIPKFELIINFQIRPATSGAIISGVIINERTILLPL